MRSAHYEIAVRGRLGVTLLDVALTDLSNNAEDFRSTGPEVQQAFRDGYEAGLEG